MRLSLTSLPDIVELTTFNGSINAVYESAGVIVERNATITSFNISTTDSGISLSTDNSVDPPVARISGRYEQQFTIDIAWNEPQVDVYTAPVARQADNWGDVPDPGDSGIWFLFRYQPPQVMLNTVTYTMGLTWEEVDNTIPSSPVVTPMSGTFTATQNVRFDTDANNTEFRRYV